MTGKALTPEEIAELEAQAKKRNAQTVRRNNGPNRKQRRARDAKLRKQKGEK